MSTTLQRLARWATGLQAEDIPPDVLRRARLQHLSTAGAILAAASGEEAQALRRAGPSRGPAFVLSGPGDKSSRAHALRYHTALASVLDYSDYLFWGHTSPGAVCSSWAMASRHSMADLLVATVAANEIAGRLGASTLLSPFPCLAASWVHALASAVAAARLENLEEDDAAHAYALALQNSAPAPWSTLLAPGLSRGLVVARATGAGLEAVELAASGIRASTGLLDDRQGLHEAVAYVPLRNAFTGLGSAWLTRTLAFQLQPGAPFLQVPLQAVEEILRRHVKAADRRLRPDQIDRIVVNADFLACGMERLSSQYPGLHAASITASISRSIGVLVCGQTLGPEQLHPTWIAEHRDQIAEVASRVEVRHDWQHSMALMSTLLDVAQPLFSGVTAKELREAARSARADFGSPGLPAIGSWLDIGKRRPDRLLQRLGQGSGDLAEMDVEAWRYRFGVEVKLFTTRGGWWPERRDIAMGAPGWNWEQTLEGVQDKFAQGREDRRARACTLLERDDGSPGKAWVEDLLA